jgi:hypothetical protein
MNNAEPKNVDRFSSLPLPLSSSADRRWLGDRPSSHQLYISLAIKTLRRLAYFPIPLDSPESHRITVHSVTNSCGTPTSRFSRISKMSQKDRITLMGDPEQKMDSNGPPVASSRRRRNRAGSSTTARPGDHQLAASGSRTGSIQAAASSDQLPTT